MNDFNTLCVFFDYKNIVYYKEFHITKDQWENGTVWDVVDYYDAMNETDYYNFMDKNILELTAKQIDSYCYGKTAKPADDNMFRAYVEGD